MNMAQLFQLWIAEQTEAGVSHEVTGGGDEVIGEWIINAAERRETDTRSETIFAFDDGSRARVTIEAI